MKKEGNCSHKPVSANKVTEKFHTLYTDFHSFAGTKIFPSLHRTRTVISKLS